MKAKRVLILGLCWAVFAFLLLLYKALWFDDKVDAKLHPNLFEQFLFLIFIFVNWPLIIWAKILGHDPESRVLWLIGFIFTAFFWGFVTELFLVARAHKKTARTK